MKKRIRIAHIITHLELGGAQKTTLSILRRLDTSLFEPYLITSPFGELKNEALALTGIKVLFIRQLNRRISLSDDILSYVKIVFYLLWHKIQIIHTHSHKAGILGRWAGITAGVKKIYHTVHGWPFYADTTWFVRFFYTVVERLTALITTKIIVVSKADLLAGIAKVNRDASKYEFVYYGIEYDVLKRQLDIEKNNRYVFRSQFKAVENTCLVLYISNFKPQKAPLDFVETVRQVLESGLDIRFISAGDGPLRDRAEALCARYGINKKVFFLGWRKDIASLLTAGDILLLTSRWEGMPVVFLEAMACGVPIVATDAGGESEIIINGINGFLKRKGDCAGLARDIIYLANHKDKRKVFGENSKNSFLPEYKASYMSKRISSLYIT